MTGVGLTRPTFGMVLTPLLIGVTGDLDFFFFFITTYPITAATRITTTTPATIPAIAAVSRPKIRTERIKLYKFTYNISQPSMNIIIRLRKINLFQNRVLLWSN